MPPGRTSPPAWVERLQALALHRLQRPAGGSRSRACSTATTPPVAGCSPPASPTTRCSPSSRWPCSRSAILGFLVTDPAIQAEVARRTDRVGAAAGGRGRRGSRRSLDGLDVADDHRPRRDGVGHDAAVLVPRDGDRCDVRRGTTSRDRRHIGCAGRRRPGRGRHRRGGRSWRPRSRRSYPELGVVRDTAGSGADLAGAPAGSSERPQRRWRWPSSTVVVPPVRPTRSAVLLPAVSIGIALVLLTRVFAVVAPRVLGAQLRLRHARGDLRRARLAGPHLHGDPDRRGLGPRADARVGGDCGRRLTRSGRGQRALAGPATTAEARGRRERQAAAAARLDAAAGRARRVSDDIRGRRRPRGASSRRADVWRLARKDGSAWGSACGGVGHCGSTGAAGHGGSATGRRSRAGPARARRVAVRRAGAVRGDDLPGRLLDERRRGRARRAPRQVRCVDGRCRRFGGDVDRLGRRLRPPVPGRPRSPAR